MIDSRQILSALPGSRTYAILDGARDRNLRGWIFDTRAPRWCLYRGKLPPVLQDAAPWLLQLTAGQPYTDDFFRRYWGGSCGVLLSSAAQPADLRRHLRRFLLARDEAGRKLVFRYYDPRVLRVYLPTCTSEETAAFFGPIEAYVAEARDRGSFHLFRPGTAELRTIRA
ncbi:MAG TPA: DUF4123 domain-containing protein [Myxococcales bacterium]|jgi:hypothetical protein|nr:DUF4123 domain-containing protein [Myxococcales bacterium]